MKFIKTKYSKNSKKNDEKGQALVLVLVLLLVGILIITSSMGFIGTSLKTNRVYINNTNDLYAAEAGLQDGIYKLLNKSEIQLNALFSAPLNASFNNPSNYSDYDYDPAHSWAYYLPDQVNNNPAAKVKINNDNVSIAIKNIWVPYGITAPLPTSQAVNILTNSGGASNVNLVVTGGVYSLPNYQVNVTYTGTATALPITSIGVWLPSGFTYNNGSSLLASKVPGTTEQVVQCAGNQAVIWTFPTGTLFSNLLASLGTDPNSIAIQFQYATNLQKIPEALAWINVTPNNEFKYSYTWNADIKVYDLIADAGNTEIESYVPKSATRTLGSAINGDYVAFGNSLMIMGQGTPSNPGSNTDGIRYTALANNPYNLTTIPMNADIQGAYLYWTGWFNGSTSDLGVSDKANIIFKINGNAVYFDSNGNPKQGTSAITCNGPQTVHQTDTDPTVGGYSYSCEVDATKLIQFELAREVPNASNYPGNALYDVGYATGCKLGDTGNQGSYAGWSLVIIYSSPTTLGHQLYLYDKFSNAQGTGYGGSDIDPTTGGAGPGGVISGFIVPPQDPNTQDLDPNGVNGQGVSNYDPAATLTAFVGEGDWCYSDDFLAFNAPQPTSLNNALNINKYPSKNLLWDGITRSKTTNGSSSSQLPNTAAVPGNVWNDSAQNGTSIENGITYKLPQYQASAQDGIDIKTFVILWESGLLQPGDTLARIDMPTSYEQFNLVYLILSFRSSVTSGGAISYLIRRR